MNSTKEMFNVIDGNREVTEGKILLDLAEQKISTDEANQLIDKIGQKGELKRVK